ncbi:unnamed protein product [Kluyveromyces dobzhanskii CBS 2104]|uniref:Protein IBD2 n=1 Tax=Kluyveromyces dobzhanskii CBS 2104 TaxID=1427455 RepID=A0A0A8L428_9SACH|nr:unnamed protein product [Kluyveromyces dobzhanskii CBS 2104]
MSNGNTSIEFVSENGPIDFSVMMQEGVKALTKILSTHLQDNPDLVNEKSMKVIFKDNNGKLEPVFAPSEKIYETINNEKVEEVFDDNQDDEEADEDYEVIEFDNEGNYHVCAKGSQNLGSDYDETEPSKIEHVDDSTDMYNHEEDEMVKSDNNHFLPKDQRHEHIGGQRVNPISSTEHEIVFEHENGDNITFSPSEIMNDEYLDKKEQHQVHHHNHSDRRTSSCACQNGHEGFRYPDHVSNSAPNFRALLQHTLKGKQMCPFCEYYVVFGTPPAYIMRWASSKINVEHSQYKMGDQMTEVDSGLAEHDLENTESNETNKQQAKKKKKKSKRKNKR